MRINDKLIVSIRIIFIIEHVISTCERDCLCNVSPDTSLLHVLMLQCALRRVVKFQMSFKDLSKYGNLLF